MQYAPIVLFCYNRLDHFKKVILSLKRNKESVYQGPRFPLQSTGLFNFRDFKYPALSKTPFNKHVFNSLQFII